MNTIILINYLIINSLLTIHSINWLPKYKNEEIFDEPYDFVEEKQLPNFTQYGPDYDWIGIAGTSLTNKKQSFIAFTGTQQNKNNNTVFSKKSGIIVLCKSEENSTKPMGLEFVCKSLEEHDLDVNYHYFGANVKSTKTDDNDNKAAFIYCDPLWMGKSFQNPTGKCKLSIVNDFDSIIDREFEICEAHETCVGGFSTDILSIDRKLKIVFGLPFLNSTKTLNNAMEKNINDADVTKYNSLNFGFSVTFSGDGGQYVLSPVGGGDNTPFIKMHNNEIIHPLNIIKDRFGGFGTSMDTIKVGFDLYGVVIGSPYLSKGTQKNVGAIYLACQGNIMDTISGELDSDYFGYAIARLGDIDNDGSEEFVVSSPNLNMNKPGKIYIYKSNKNCTIVKTPLQIYRSQIKGFGISISRGFDIDFNGKMDFFVTALGYQTPFLFKMPSSETVICSFNELNSDNIISESKEFDIKVTFDSATIRNYDDYTFQVAIDSLNKGELRFQLKSMRVTTNNLIISLWKLLSIADMDFKTVPFKMSVRGIRSCKINNTSICYLSKTAHINLLKCERNIKIPQHSCKLTDCLADLNVNIKKDPLGSIIHYGDKFNERNIKVTVNNKGPESTTPIHVLVTSTTDIEITNIINCTNFACKISMDNKHKVSVIIKDIMEKRETDKDDFQMVIKLIYRNENISINSGINVNVWGVNDDNNLLNNNDSLIYSVVMTPNLTLFWRKINDTIIDSRKFPSELYAHKRLPIQELGTELQYWYIIENKGPDLKNVEFTFTFPYKTENGKYILYLMDRTSFNDQWSSNIPFISNSANNVSCYVDESLLNPLMLVGLEPLNEKDSRAYNRSKRSLSSQDSDSSSIPNFDLYGPHENQSEVRQTTIIECNKYTKGIGIPICKEIVCKLQLIPRDRSFDFHFRTWLISKTFFDGKMADVVIKSTFQSDLTDIPNGLQISDKSKRVGPISSRQHVIFNEMKILDDKTMPLWPIILAIVIGILLLVFIIVAAYFCGFFRRKRLRKERQKRRQKTYENNKMKDEKPLTSDF